MIFFGGENVVYSIAALQSWEQPFLSVLVFLVYVFICFRSMNEDLCACWTRFYLEKFPVRRFLCELIWVECRVMWFQLLCTGLLTSDQVYLLLYVYVHDSAEMLFILLKDFNFQIWFFIDHFPVLFSCCFFVLYPLLFWS